MTRAPEPKVDLALALTSMGAKIEGLDTDVLTITGVSSLNGATWSVIPDATSRLRTLWKIWYLSPDGAASRAPRACKADSKATTTLSVMSLV